MAHANNPGSRRLVAAALVALALVPATVRAQDEAAAAPAKPAFDYAAMPLRVGVWTDKAEGEVYAKGDAQSVTFQTNEDAYAVVYRIDTEGRVSVLWPRSRMDDGFVFGGHEYVLPVQGGPRLRVADVEGEGFVEAVVSRYPFDLRALEVDFHHETGGKPYDFRVAGDPFLAMNEVNYAVTGLADTEDYVVTNYASYYVHRTVDHPRYLCGQCHDGVGYDPYDDTCKLEITVDYRWANGWWGTYGYYPAYCYPAYVYVDPWTWRPWVNFWYDPWWHCPTVSVCWWNDPWYSWCDNPHYHGNCYTGTPRYKPLTPGTPDGTRTKVREYGAIQPLTVARSTDARTRDGAARPGSGDARGAYVGQGPASRTQPVIADNNRTRSTAGLRIRDGAARSGSTGGRTAVRHTAGGSGDRPELVPVTGGGTRSETRAAPGSTVGRGADTTRRAPSGSADGRTIKPVEPRQRTQRIWNTGRSDDSGTRRPEQVRPGGSSRGSSGTVRNGDATNRKGGSSGSDTRVRSGDNSRDSGTTNRSSGSRDGAVKSGGSRSGDSGRSSGGSNSGGGGSRSSGSGGGSRSGSSQNSGGSRGRG